MEFNCPFPFHLNPCHASLVPSVLSYSQGRLKDLGNEFAAMQGIRKTAIGKTEQEYGKIVTKIATSKASFQPNYFFKDDIRFYALLVREAS